MTGRKDPAAPAKEGAKLFLDLLKTAPVDFAKTKVIVMDMNDYDNEHPDFIREVNTLLADSAYSAHFRNNVQTIDITKVLDKKDYFLLDDHLKPSAHEKVAAAISKMVQ